MLDLLKQRVFEPTVWIEHEPAFRGWKDLNDNEAIDQSSVSLRRAGGWQECPGREHC